MCTAPSLGRRGISRAPPGETDSSCISLLVMYARRSRYARRRRYPARKRRTRVARSYSRKRTSRRRYGGGRRFKKRVLSIASRKSTIPCGVVGPTVSSMSHSTMLRWRSLLGVQPPYPTTRLSMLRRTVTRRKSSSSALKNASIHMPFSRSFGGVSCSGPTNDLSNSEPSRDWVVPDSDLALRTESQICRLSTSRS